MSIYRRNQNTLARPPKNSKKHEKVLSSRRNRIEADKFTKEGLISAIVRMITTGRRW